MTQDDPVSTSFFLAGLKLDLNEELVRGFEVGLGYFIGFSQLYRVFFRVSSTALVVQLVVQSSRPLELRGRPAHGRSHEDVPLLHQVGVIRLPVF